MKGVYVVLAHTNEVPCESWLVMAYADEKEAIEHKRRAAEEVENIRSNIRRATMALC